MPGKWHEGVTEENFVSFFSWVLLKESVSFPVWVSSNPKIKQVHLSRWLGKPFQLASANQVPFFFFPPLSSFTHYLLRNNMKYQVDYNSSRSFRPSKFNDSMHIYYNKIQWPPMSSTVRNYIIAKSLYGEFRFIKGTCGVIQGIASGDFISGSAQHDSSITLLANPQPRPPTNPPFPLSCDHVFHH